jgi:hypothetical protein
MSGGKERCVWRWNVAFIENNRQIYIRVLDKIFKKRTAYVEVRTKWEENNKEYSDK